MARGVKENRRAGGPYKADYADKYLMVDFTIEDPGTFTTPWKSEERRGLRSEKLATFLAGTISYSGSAITRE